MDRSIFRSVVSSSWEIAAVIIWSLGTEEKLICCKLGHRAEKVMIVEATNAPGRSDVLNRMVMEMVLEETNKRIDGTNSTVKEPNLRVSKFGSKGSL